LSKFGEENLIVVGVKDDFYSKNFAAWTKLMNELKAQKRVDLIVSINDLKKKKKTIPYKN
jgi:hypothetical protein